MLEYKNMNEKFSIMDLEWLLQPWCSVVFRNCSKSRTMTDFTNSDSVCTIFFFLRIHTHVQYPLTANKDADASVTATCDINAYVEV